MECVDQNTEYQLEDMIAESSTKNSKKSFTKLNAKAIPYTSKGKGYPSQSPISHLRCKVFKVVQKKNIHKLITYYKNCADLDKTINIKLNLQEFKNVWIRYFSSQLSRDHNRPSKNG
ncbi:hypothetical protein RhiirB3_453233 [Rhizophagus irregularis]|nr:hypothetical protein RhiirB3_453233 [Rhizophagus irregularis]